MNPYVIFGAAVLSICIAMFALANRTTAAQKAQKILNDEHEKAIQKKQDLASKTDGLIGKINSETETIYSQVKAYKELLKLYPELGNMTFEEFKKLPQAQQDKMLSGISDTREMDEATKAYEDDLKKIEILKESISVVSTLPNGGVYLLEYNNQLEVANSLAKLHKDKINEIKENQWESNTPLEEKIKHYEKIQAELEKERDELNKQVNPHKVLQSYADGMAGSWYNAKDALDNMKLNALNKQLDDTTGKINSLSGESSSVVKNKAYWEKKKGEAEVARDALDTSKKNSAAWEIYTKEINKAQSEIAKYDTADNARDAAADRLAKQTELSRAILESEQKLQSDYLAVMEDGKDKRVLLADREYKDTLAAINKDREEYKTLVNESGGKEDPTKLSVFDSREKIAENKRNKDVVAINKEYAKEFIEHQAQLTDSFLSEDAKRLSSVKDRYDKEREWADKQLEGGGMNEDQHEAYTATINKAEVQENLNFLLDKYEDYDAKRRKIEQQYTDEVNTLSAQRTEANKTEVDAAIAQAGKRREEDLSSLSFDKFKDTDLWSKMFGDLDKMALPTLKNILDQAKKVNTSTWNPENIKEYEDAITRLEDTVLTRSPFSGIESNWKELIKAFKEGDKDGIANAFSNLDTAVQKVNADLKTIGGGIGDIFGDEAGYAAGQVLELTSALGGFVTAGAKFASGDILGAIGDVVASIGSLFSMGKKVKEMNREAREENQKFYDEALKGETEYQALIRERLRLEQQMGETTLAYNERISKELEKQRSSVQSDYDRTIKDLQGQSYISGKGYQHGTWVRKAETWNEYESLAGKSYDEIEGLYMQGKLEGKAKELFEHLQKLKEEGADIDKMLVDQAESFREYISGMSFDSLKESIKSAFDDGKMDIQETADFTRNAFKKAMIQALEAKVLEKQLQPFLDSFQKDAEAGTLFDKMDFYEKWINGIADDSNKFMGDLMSIPGMEDIFKGEEKGVSGQLQAAMTEGTASQLVGLWNSTAMDMRELKNIGYQNGESVRSIMTGVSEMLRQSYLIEQSTRRGADNTDGLIGELRDGFGSLDRRLATIEKNTKSYTGRG